MLTLNTPFDYKSSFVCRDLCNFDRERKIEYLEKHELTLSWLQTVNHCNHLKNTTQSSIFCTWKIKYVCILEDQVF